MWVFNQQRDFMSAMPHVQALDERKTKGGRRLMELAEVAAKNKDLETAYECYAAVAAKGPNGTRHDDARQAMLKVRAEQVTGTFPLDSAAARTLSEQYRTTLRDLGETPSTSGHHDRLGTAARLPPQRPRPSCEVLLDRAVNMPGLNLDDREAVPS